MKVGAMKNIIMPLASSLLLARGVNAFGRSSFVARRHMGSSLSATQAIAEKVLANPKFPPEWPYTPEDFSRQDESDDSFFYEPTRLVYHIDDAAVAALTKHYATEFKDGEDVLDICSSWVSHYPKDWNGGNVVGLGMNEKELSANEQLSSFNVADLNENTVLPYEDNSFDKVTCVVSIDYLNNPKEIFSEVGRVLRPGGEFLVSMSNRCFPTKAFRIWLATSDLEHVFMVGSFFHYSGMFDPAECKDLSPNPGMSDPLFVVKAAKKK
jgi:SAM-dependent methyltransferase